MYVIKLKTMVMVIMGAVFLFVGAKAYWNSTRKVETIATNFNNVIVVDAGHGDPDSGASVGSLMESDLNLAIAKKLQEELEERGYMVIMTRENEKNIADDDKQSKISEMKASDLTNRVTIINESGADFCISIHMNKYTNAKYWGWQTFYNENSEEGKKLANCIQQNIMKVIKKENKRSSLKIDGIKIVDKTNIPVVIVECGFLSNPEEANLLQKEEYQMLLVEGISNGVEEFYQ